MKFLLIAPVTALALLLALPAPGSRVLELPAGTIELHGEMRVDNGMELRGAAAGTVLRAAADFQGRALLVLYGSGITLRGFTIDGNRADLEQRTGLPPDKQSFSRFTRGNGILAVGVSRLRVENMRFRNIPGFALLISRSRDIRVDQVDVEESGSHDTRGRNNGTGGILVEEGTSDFRVTRSAFRNVRGNGVWTRSASMAVRNTGGWIAFNRFEDLARDAILIGNASNVRVEDNQGARIGYPVELVDVESEAYPVALATAGDVEHSSYARNRFTDVDGKCIDLRGFHDGDVAGNSCVNRPDPDLYPFGDVGILFSDSNLHAPSNRIRVIGNLLDGVKYGGIAASGTGHTIAHNRLLNLNLAHSPGEADALRSGIYLGSWSEPSRGNLVEDNQIAGYEMKVRCIGIAPGVPPSANTIRNNRCE